MEAVTGDSHGPALDSVDAVKDNIVYILQQHRKQLDNFVSHRKCE